MVTTLWVLFQSFGGCSSGYRGFDPSTIRSGLLRLLVSHQHKVLLSKGFQCLGCCKEHLGRAMVQVLHFQEHWYLFFFLCCCDTNKLLHDKTIVFLLWTSSRTFIHLRRSMSHKALKSKPPRTSKPQTLPTPNNSHKSTNSKKEHGTICFSFRAVSPLDSQDTRPPPAPNAGSQHQCSRCIWEVSH